MADPGLILNVLSHFLRLQELLPTDAQVESDLLVEEFPRLLGRQLGKRACRRFSGAHPWLNFVHYGYKDNASGRNWAPFSRGKDVVASPGWLRLARSSFALRRQTCSVGLRSPVVAAVLARARRKSRYVVTQFDALPGDSVILAEALRRLCHRSEFDRLPEPARGAGRDS